MYIPYNIGHSEVDLRRSRGKYSSIDGVPVSAIVSGASDMHMHEIISRPDLARLQ